MFEFVGTAIEYRVLGDDQVRHRFVPAQGASDDEVLEVSATFQDGVMVAGVTPTVDVVLKGFSLCFKYAADADDVVLLNGYQSWTDTVERPVSARMRGLEAVPGAVVDHWTLDGGADHRFVDYTGKPGMQHGWTYGYLRRGNACHLVASLDESDGFTLLELDCEAGLVTASPECPLGVMRAGKPRRLARIAYVAMEGESFDDAKEVCFDRWFNLMGVSARKAPLLTGYTSWYRHYDDITQEKLLHDLEGAVQAFTAFDTYGHEKLFQIDDGYARVGDWLDVDTQRFPQGLAPLAVSIDQAGFVPGLWMAPFVCEKESRLAAEHPDWLLRNTDGTIVRTGCHWSGGLALDIAKPAVQEYVKRCVGTAVNDWGFKLLKLDFLFAACLVPHAGMNRGQLMTLGIDLLREAAGEAWLLGCGVPLASAFGKVEYCRIGCDVGLDWDDKPHMRLLNRERVSTCNSLANTIGRSPLNGRAFINDPDVVFLRDDVTLTPDQRQLLLTGDACFGGMLLTSDDMGAWSLADRNAFQEALRIQQFANRRS